jgi:hypothetical protein
MFLLLLLLVGVNHVFLVGRAKGEKQLARSDEEGGGICLPIPHFDRICKQWM